MVLPVFVTGKKPEPPPARHAATDEKLPSAERGMLIFVAALLGLGTIAVVSMMGFGLTSAKPKSGTPHRTPVASASAVPLLPPPAPAPSAAPSSAPTPARSTPAARRTTPARVLLGTLSRNDVDAYCVVTDRSMARPPENGSGQWTCGGRRGTRFTPTDVCRWRFSDKGAYAVVGNIMDPATWRCYT